MRHLCLVNAGLSSKRGGDTCLDKGDLDLSFRAYDRYHCNRVIIGSSRESTWSIAPDAVPIAIDRGSFRLEGEKELEYVSYPDIVRENQFPGKFGGAQHL